MALIRMATTSLTVDQALAMIATMGTQFNVLATWIAVIAAIFGVIVTIVVGFFAIRQLNVDREIRRYRDDIRKQQKNASDVVRRMTKDLSAASAVLAEARVTKNQLEEELKKPESPQVQQEILKLQEKIDGLEDAISYSRGALSASPSVMGGGIDESLIANSPSSVFYGSIPETYTVAASGQERCKKCKKYYSKSGGFPGVLASDGVFTWGEDASLNKCPHCGNIN